MDTDDDGVQQKGEGTWLGLRSHEILHVDFIEDAIAHGIAEAITVTREVNTGWDEVRMEMARLREAIPKHGHVTAIWKNCW